MRRISVEQRVLIAAIVVAIVASCTEFFRGPKTFNDLPYSYTEYNNYLIFKESYNHLVGHQDLYQLYLDEHWDYFKYSPTFALAFAPFTVLPDLMGLCAWNLLNLLIMFVAFWRLPLLTERQKSIGSVILLIESISVTQNNQSNCLLTGLFLFAYLFVQNRRHLAAAVSIASMFFIKIFGLVAGIFFLLKRQVWKGIMFCTVALIVGAILPLLVISPPELLTLYQSWAHLLATDYGMSLGYSVMGILNAWFGIYPNKLVLVAIGGVLLLMPLLRWRQYGSERFGLLYLASILIWVVIFNYKAELPSFVIAQTGIVIWYFAAPEHRTHLILFILAILLITVFPTDLTPRSWRHGFYQDYVLKAAPATIIWIKLQWSLMFTDFNVGDASRKLHIATHVE